MRWHHLQCLLDGKNSNIDLTVNMDGWDGFEEDEKKEIMKKICDFTGEKEITDEPEKSI